MTTTTTATRRVSRTIRGQPASDGAGVKLTRVIGQRDLDMLDPFLLLDEFRSDSAADYIGGFPNHPHRGFETVTYMLAGRMRHGDNQGNSGLLTPGSVQWMTAGRGIVHSEMPEQEDGLMWGFQLWVNLPAKDKMTAPRYQDIAPQSIPETDPATGVHVRVLAGSVGDVTGPVSGIAVEPVYLDITLQPGARFAAPVPASHNAFAYVYAGAADIGPADAARRIARGELAVLERVGEDVLISAGVRVRVLAGSVGDVTGPVSGIAVEPVYLDITLQPGARFAAPVPASHNAFAYVYAGAADIGPADAARRIARGELAVLERVGEDVLISAGDETVRVIVVAGKPLNEPVAKYGPFVMNTPEQIVEAIRDFQAGKF